MDPVTTNLLVQGGTALVSLGLGWLLRHVTTTGQHPLLAALEQAVWANMAQQVAAQQATPAAPAPAAK